MRLWHKDLIPVLPNKQLISQWRECCLIAKNISENGTPNHLLVNKVTQYPINHLYVYGMYVYIILKSRNFDVNLSRFTSFECFDNLLDQEVSIEDIFPEWHTKRYLTQCYFNLQEKYDCGGMTKKEWEKIYNVVHGTSREDFWWTCEENDIEV